MITRIVKLTFKAEHVDDFLKVFHASKIKIRNFEGCKGLTLYESKNDHRIMFTYSFWENEHALDAYRNSELFKTTWEATKILFEEKPEAWSLDEVERLD